MVGEKENPYDVIITGAGPAGLTAGIECGRNHLSALILEKEEKPSPFPRGETLHSAKIFTEMLGADVLNMIGTHYTAARKFNSPDLKHSVEVYRHTPSIMFKWEDFIQLLLNRLKETSTELRCNQKVISPIVENRLCVGVELEGGTKIYGNTVMVCEGHSSEIGKQMGVPYEQINCPIVKRLITNFKGDYQGFEYFMIPAGSLEISPRFPPAILFIFPHGKDLCEVGLLVYNPLALKLKTYCDIPSEDEIMKVWNYLFENHPRFSDLMKNTQKEFEGISHIATGAVYQQFMPKMGLILVGGTIGFVQASGGSGIASSMKMAHYIIEYLIKKKISIWTPSKSNQFIRDLKKKGFWRHIIQNSKKSQRGWNLVFVKLRTAQHINNRWGFLRGFL